MFNLLKSDIYRLVHGKMLWVVTGVVVVLVTSIVVMLYSFSSPEFLAMASYDSEMYVEVTSMTSDAQSDGADSRSLEMEVRSVEGAGDVATSDAATSDGAAGDDAASGDVLAASEALDPEDFEGVSQDMRTFESPAWAISSMTIDGGCLPFITSLVVALFFASDFSTKFVRNLVMDRRGRMRYYGEKLILVGLINAYFLVVTSLVSLVAFAVAGFTYTTMDSAATLVVWLALVWLISTAYGCLTAVATWIVRSASAGVVFALIVSSGVAGAIITHLATMAAKAVPILETLTLALPFSAVGMLRGDVEQIVTTPAAGFLAFAPEALQILLVGVAWVALCAVCALTALRRRDV